MKRHSYWRFMLRILSGVVNDWWYLKAWLIIHNYGEKAFVASSLSSSYVYKPSLIIKSGLSLDWCLVVDIALSQLQNLVVYDTGESAFTSLKGATAVIKQELLFSTYRYQLCKQLFNAKCYATFAAADNGFPKVVNLRITTLSYLLLRTISIFPLDFDNGIR